MGLALAAAGPAAGSPRPGRPERPSGPSGPISLAASHSEVDYKTQHARLRNVVITQGDLKVTADHAEATGLDFKDSRWTFTGNVHITSLDQGKLASSAATVDFRNEHMQKAAVTGAPAEFEQTASKTGVFARGHANSIVYTVASATVQLQGNAWLEYGRNEITGPLLVYDIATQKLQGASTADQGERVHIVIRPKPGASATAGPPRTAPPAQGSSPEKAP